MGGELYLSVILIWFPDDQWIWILFNLFIGHLDFLSPSFLLLFIPPCCPPSYTHWSPIVEVLRYCSLSLQISLNSDCSSRLKRPESERATQHWWKALARELAYLGSTFRNSACPCDLGHGCIMSLGLPFSLFVTPSLWLVKKRNFKWCIRALTSLMFYDVFCQNIYHILTDFWTFRPKVI